MNVDQSTKSVKLVIVLQWKVNISLATAQTMRNKKHIMYTHPMCRFYVKSSDSAVAHGASQCLCHHRGPRGKAKREERNEWVRSKEIGGNSFHCSSKRGFSYDVCNILTGNQCILIEFSIQNPGAALFKQVSAIQYGSSFRTVEQ